MTQRPTPKNSTTLVLKFILGIISLAMMVVITFILFKRLPPIPKLIFLAVDYIILHYVLQFLIKTLKNHNSNENN